MKRKLVVIYRIAGQRLPVQNAAAAAADTNSDHTGDDDGRFASDGAAPAASTKARHRHAVPLLCAKRWIRLVWFGSKETNHQPSE